MSPADRAKTLDELGIPPSRQVIIHVGNFRPAKDHETLIQSMSKIVEQSKEVHLLLVGNGPLLPKIRQLVASKGLQHHVHFAGPAGPRNDVPRLLMASDCFIFPSRWEGLPGAVLEALAAGLPVVASDLPAIREIASDSDNVHTVSVGDIDGFARRLSEILADPNSHHRPTGQIPDRFRFDNYVRKVLCLYT
jgi:glycosyltransferase involved in cell wall biosynthesis